MKPISDMRMRAIAIHEVFASYVGAGFTEEQALELVKTEIAAVVQKDEK